jgi:hypothetical protein
VAKPDCQNRILFSGREEISATSMIFELFSLAIEDSREQSQTSSLRI